MCREGINCDAEDDVGVELSFAKKLRHCDGIQQAAHIDRHIETRTSIYGGGIGESVLEQYCRGRGLCRLGVLIGAKAIEDSLEG